MATKFKNTSNVALSVAVWLANDTYDYNDDRQVISVTTLLKPVKQIILEQRAARSNVIDHEEISNMVASRMEQPFTTNRTFMG